MRTLDYTSEELGQTPRLRVALITETWPPEVNGVAMTLRRMVDGLIARGHGVQLIRPRQTPSDTAAPDGALEEVLAHSLRLPRYEGCRRAAGCCASGRCAGPTSCMSPPRARSGGRR